MSSGFDTILKVIDALSAKVNFNLELKTRNLRL